MATTSVASRASNPTQLNFNMFAARKLNCSIQKQYLGNKKEKKTIHQSITTVQFTTSMQKKKNKTAVYVMG